MYRKAEHTLATAGFLTTQKYPNESVHCSYYAVFQYMVYFLDAVKTNPIKYAKQKEMTRDKDSHEIILTEIGNRMNAPKSEEKRFKEKVRLLKSMRVQADYELEPITLENSLAYKQIAEGLIAQLKRYFKDKL